MEMQTVVVLVTAYTEQYFKAAGTSSIKKCFQQYLYENYMNMDGLFPKRAYKYLVYKQSITTCYYECKSFMVTITGIHNHLPGLPCKLSKSALWSICHSFVMT
jgi:hypothetical protein